MINKYERVVFVLIYLAINSVDILYMSAHKFNMPVAELYIVLVTLVILVLMVLNKSSFTTISIIWFFVYIIYLSFQLMNGVHNTNNYIFAFVPYLSLILIPLIARSYMDMNRLDQLWLLQSLYKYTILLYCFMDFMSIFLLNKSQHVLLTNILPYTTISLIILIKYSDYGKSKRMILLYCFYVLWIFLSLFLFTNDFRPQLKSLLVTTFIIFGAVTFAIMGVVNKSLQFRSWSRNLSTLLAILIIGIGTFLTIFLYFSPIVPDILNRETSYFLRNAVSLHFMNELVTGGFWHLIFGYGLGSSYKEIDILYNGVVYTLKSHSGFVSLIYEHGLMFFAFIIFSLIWSFNVLNRKTKFFDSSFLIIIFFCFIILNLFYLSAVFVPNYSHQSQLVILLLCIIYLKSYSKR